MGLLVKTLPYYKNRTFDVDGYISGLKSAPLGSVIILHAWITMGKNR